MEKWKVAVFTILFHDHWAQSLVLQLVLYLRLPTQLRRLWIQSDFAHRLMIYWVSWRQYFVELRLMKTNLFQMFAQRVSVWKSLMATWMIFVLLVLLHWLLWLSFVRLAWNGKQRHKISCWPSLLRLYLILLLAAFLDPAHPHKPQRDLLDLVVRFYAIAFWMLLDKCYNTYFILSAEVFWSNWGPDYRFSEKVDQSFFSVFAIFFPSGKWRKIWFLYELYEFLEQNVFVEQKASTNLNTFLYF